MPWCLFFTNFNLMKNSSNHILFFFKIGLKFFLGREIPKEPLVFMIRCLGGQVSWDNTAAPGSTFNVEDNSITHQICDRPRDSVDMKHIERFYIQPQWVSVHCVKS